MSQPGVELLKPALVHSRLATLASFPGAHEQRTATLIDIRLGHREGRKNPQTRAPQHSDQAADP